MKQNIASKVKTLLEEVIIQHGFSLWDITFGKEGGEMLLTVTVDCDKEISLDTLSPLNEAVNAILDEADPIEGAYSLMLESAGAERPLKTESHIQFAIDKKAHVELKLYKAIDGIKEFDGKIISFDGENLCFEAEIKEETKPLKKGQKPKKTQNVSEEIKRETKTYNFERKAISKMCAYL
jgi:ribosome maturation factor RimP